MKIIHFADFHLGCDTHGTLDPATRLPDRVLDFLDSLDALIEFAKDENIDLILFAGDAFHKNSPDPSLLREFGERVVAMAEICPVVLLVGNHDMPGVYEKASAVDIFSTVKIPNVIVGRDYDVHVIDTKSGKIQIATVPYPFKNRLLSSDEKKSKDANTIYKQNFANVIQDLASRIVDDYPAILLGHFTVNAAMWGSERMMYAGNDAEVDIETLVSDAWDYVALGHLHYQQNISRIAGDNAEYIPPIVYAGSLDRVDFSEEHDDKGFIFIELDEAEINWEQVLVDARPFVTLNVDVRDARNQTAKIISKIEKADVDRAIVRVRIITEDGRAKTINKKHIISKLTEQGARYVHEISIKEEAVNRSRLDNDIQLMNMPHQDMLKTYFQTIDIKGKELKQLMSVAADIMESVNE